MTVTRPMPRNWLAGLPCPVQRGPMAPQTSEFLENSGVFSSHGAPKRPTKRSETHPIGIRGSRTSSRRPGRSAVAWRHDTDSVHGRRHRRPRRDRRRKQRHDGGAGPQSLEIGTSGQHPDRCPSVRKETVVDKRSSPGSSQRSKARVCQAYGCGGGPWPGGIVSPSGRLRR